MIPKIPIPRSAPLWLLLCLLPACDSNGPNERTSTTVAVLYGLSSFNQPALGRQHFCTLSGAWKLPAWPDSTASDTATLVFSRQLLATGPGNLLRDTVLGGVTVSWVRVDSTHLNLGLGPPISISFSGGLDSAAGTVWRGVWPCPTALPFGADSALVANGYEPDSLQPGVLTVSRIIPVD